MLFSILRMILPEGVIGTESVLPNRNLRWLASLNLSFSCRIVSSPLPC